MVKNKNLVDFLQSFKTDENIPEQFRYYAAQDALQEYLNLDTLRKTNKELCQIEQEIYEKVLSRVHYVTKKA